MSSEYNSNRYLPYFDIYYYLYFVIGLLSQLLLFLLIIKRSPPTLDSLKYFLFNTWAVQIIVIFMGFFTQSRCLQNTTSYAVLPHGPCRSLGPEYCFAGYHISLAVSMSVALSIANTVAFRYLLLKYNWITRQHFIVMICASHMPSLVLVVIPFTDKWDFEKTRLLTYQQHPNYNLSIYEPFPGFADITSIQYLLATSIVVIFAYVIPILSGGFTTIIFSMIKKNKNMSKRTKNTAMMLIRGLACQTILPVVSYIPVVSLYLYSLFYSTEIILNEHFLMLCSGLPALIDPFISFYFIVPYRQVILQFITRRNRRIGSTVVASTVSAKSIQYNL